MAFVEGLVEELASRQEAMKSNFLEGRKEFTENLYHGLLTTLSIIMGEWGNFITMVRIDREKTQQLYSRAIDEIMKVAQSEPDHNVRQGGDLQESRDVYLGQQGHRRSD